MQKFLISLLVYKLVSEATKEAHASASGGPRAEYKLTRLGSSELVNVCKRLVFGNLRKVTKIVYFWFCYLYSSLYMHSLYVMCTDVLIDVEKITLRNCTNKIVSQLNYSCVDNDIIRFPGGIVNNLTRFVIHPSTEWYYLSNLKFKLYKEML